VRYSVTARAAPGAAQVLELEFNALNRLIKIFTGPAAARRSEQRQARLATSVKKIDNAGHCGATRNFFSGETLPQVVAAFRAAIFRPLWQASFPGSLIEHTD
jgi:hypothetical protein